MGWGIPNKWNGISTAGILDLWQGEYPAVSQEKHFIYIYIYIYIYTWLHMENANANPHVITAAWAPQMLLSSQKQRAIFSPLSVLQQGK